MALKKTDDGHLIENKEFYRMLVENAMDALIIGDEQGNYIYTSPSFERLFGYKQQELVGRSSFDLFHPEDVSVNKDRLKMMLEGKEFPSIEFRFRKKNGDYVWCDVGIKAVRTARGDNRVIVVARDISERRKLEEELKKYSENLEGLVAEKSEELSDTKDYLEQLVSRLPLALVSWDREFKVKTWNPAAAQIFGFSEPEFLGKSVANLFSQRQGASTVNKIWNELQKGESANVVGQNVTKDGKSIVCNWTNTPLKDANGNIHDILSMVQDVTEKKRLEERLKEITYALSGIKAGESYLASSLQYCLKIAFDLNSHGVKCLSIVRENPDSLVKDYNFKAEDIVLLSLRPVKDFKAINDLQEIAITITKFLENGGGVIILGGLEYLVSRNGFNPVFMMIQEKRFEVLEAEATLLVPVNMETLDIREKGLLTSELKLIG